MRARPGWRAWARAAAVAVCVTAAVTGTLAQDQFVFGGRRPAAADNPPGGNTEYDGRFVFVRLRYGMGLGGFGGGGFGFGGLPPWAHDYPRAEQNFMEILQEITLMRPRLDGSNILTLDDPALYQFPVAYMSEPGFWRPTPDEVAGLRAYLEKGGFIIFDDFEGPAWDHLQLQMGVVLPGRVFVELDGTHPVFHSFFEIDDPLSFAPYYEAGPPTFWGIHEDNDPAKRLIAVANVNNDIGEYWEFSGTGLVPIDLSNEAYKFGVNYVVYALTH